MTTEELKAELRRREEKHNVKVGPIVVALNLDEMQEVFNQILVYLVPPKQESQLHENEKEEDLKFEREMESYYMNPLNYPG